MNQQSRNPPLAGDIRMFTADERDRISKALNKQLGPEFLSKRSGPGGTTVSYIEGWKAINLANDIFTPFGWNTEVRETHVDYIDERNGRVALGLYAIVRVVLKDGTFREDMGYGSIEGARSKAQAFDKCRKEAITDAVKRALRQFGNALGNCIYDKTYLNKVNKVTAEPVSFNQDRLLRGSHHGTIMKEEETSMASTISTALVSSISSTTSTSATSAIQQATNSDTLLAKSDIKSIVPAPALIRQALPSSITTNNNHSLVNTSYLEQQSKQNAEFRDPPKQRSSKKMEDDDSFVFSDDMPPLENLAGTKSVHQKPLPQIQHSRQRDQQQPLNHQRAPSIPDSDTDFGDDEDDNEIETMILDSRAKRLSQQREPLVDTTKQQNNFVNPGIPAATPKPISTIHLTNLSQPTPTPAQIPKEVTFVTARAADNVMKDPALQHSTKLKYDATHLTESLKKSTFVNHSRSTPIKRSLANSSTTSSPYSNLGGSVQKRSIGLPSNQLPQNKRLHK